MARLTTCLSIAIALAAAGCGKSVDGEAGSGGSAGAGGSGGSGGEGGTGGAPSFCTGMPVSTSCGDDGEVCDGEGRCVVCADGEDCFSDGSDGPFLADEDVELPGGEYDFTTFTIEEGVTVSVTGSDPLIIRTQDGATINGVLTADGGDGTNGVANETHGEGGAGVAGGASGGDGAFGDDPGPVPGTAGLGPGAGGGGTERGPGAGASYGSGGGNAALGDAMAGPLYGDAELTTLEGGSGGGGGSGAPLCGGGGGGGGAGIIKLTALGQLSIGMLAGITANGGNGGTDDDAACGGGGGGSGGTIWLRATNVANGGLISAQGGTGVSGGASNIAPVGGFGRIRIDMENPTDTGTVLPLAGLEGGSWYVPADL